MGRSPVLSTLIVAVSRPGLSSISPSATTTSPGSAALAAATGSRARADRLVHGDELLAVLEEALDLEHSDESIDAWEDVVGR